MIAYLRSPRVAKFSREGVLKQEEALAELDQSIDEWASKLEQAENRRTRIRQKLLEHLSAALVLRQPTFVADNPDDQTPPRSPRKEEESPHSANRRDVESIKIYADAELYSLFANIELQMDKMVSTGSPNSPSPEAQPETPSPGSF
jgi:lysyl-tRNA synthetase class II